MIGQWGSGEPNGGAGENCGGMAQVISNKYADLGCGKLYYSVCEMPYTPPGKLFKFFFILGLSNF